MQILGLGSQTELSTIIRLAEREYRIGHNLPARLMLRAGDVEIVVYRLEKDDTWVGGSARIFVPTESGAAETLKALHQEFPQTSTLTEMDGQFEFRCQLEFKTGKDKPTVAKKLSLLWTWPETWRVTGEDFEFEPLSPERLFLAMDELGASDIHLYPGSPPVFRIDNQTVPTGRFAPVSEQQIERLIHELAPDASWAEFQSDQQCSFNYRQVDMAHSRVSAFIKSGVPHCTIRYLPERIPTFEDLHIPRKTMERLAGLNEGLILVSGMTGSGKSTTVASLIDWMNENQSLHILTIESPVEYVHHNKQSIISQRNVGTDAPTAIKAVHGALRHDPDVIFIGEMRDSDTIRAAIDAASTGHLVISTFHANTAAEVMNRIVSFFDPVERDLVRLQLRDCIRCVMCQRLVPKRGGGRVPALEFLFTDTTHILECILNGNTGALRVAMQQTSSQSAIFEQSLMNLVREGLVLDSVAAQYASNRDLFEQMRLGTYAVPSVDTMLHRHGS
jgi:twitching motility protein PilT